MAKIIIIDEKGWLGHPKGSRVDTETVKPLKKKPTKKEIAATKKAKAASKKETAASKKADAREKATK